MISSRCLHIPFVNIVSSPSRASYDSGQQFALATMKQKHPLYTHTVDRGNTSLLKVAVVLRAAPQSHSSLFFGSKQANMARLPWPVWASLAANVVLFAAKLTCFLATGSLAVAASLVDSTVVRAWGVCGWGWGLLLALLF